MPAITASGVSYAIPDDDFDPSGFALAPSLDGRLIVPVANTAERAAVAAQFNPSSSKPLIVRRADAPQYKRYEESIDGFYWYALGGADSGWTNPVTWGLDFANNSTFKSRQIGNRVFLKGRLQRVGSMTGTPPSPACVLPIGHYSTTETLRITGGSLFINGSPNPYQVGLVLHIDPSGNVTPNITTAASWVFVDGVSYLVD